MRGLICFGLICFVVSLFLPVGENEDGDVWDGYDSFTRSYQYGTSGTAAALFELSALDGDDRETRVMRHFLRWAGWAWVANVGLLLGLFTFVVRSKEVLKMFALLTVSCVLLALSGAFIPINGGKAPEFMIGYWAWIASISFCLAGQILAIREAPEPKSEESQESADGETGEDSDETEVGEES